MTKSETRRLQRLWIESALAEGQLIDMPVETAHYLQNVLRMMRGDELRLFNNTCGEFLAAIESTAKKAVTLKIGAKVREPAETPDIWLCAAPIKKAHFDYIIEKATELGVARIQPILTQRTQVREVNQERCRSIAREAAEQSERLDIPEIAEPIKLVDLLDHWPAGRTPILAAELGDAVAASDARDRLIAARSPSLLIGPEGGFAEEELALMKALPGALPLRLGPRILRADTAALAALTLWQTAAGDWRRLS